MIGGIARTDRSVLGRWWWTVDRLTLLMLVMLAAIGVLLTLSASPPVAERLGLDPLHFVRRQTMILPFALLVMCGVSLLGPRQVRRLAVLMLAVCLFLLVATLLGGSEIKGARRWIAIGGFSVQPSEFAKPAFVVVAAWMFSARRLGEEIPGYTISAALFAVFLMLLLLQPDVGQAAIVTVVWFTQWFLAGLSMASVATLAGLALCGMIGAYFLFPHVASRVDRFLDPESGNNYQVDRSTDAFMNGGLFGQGPGEGDVKHILPDAHSDFIFAVAGEELGLVTCLGIVLLFALIVLRGFTRILNNNDLFVVLAATGLLAQFGLQAIINMASTLSLIPTKGMTLPFISYGGSSLMALSIGMGMLLALTRRNAGELIE